MDTIRGSIAERTTGQLGLITRPQLSEIGLTRDQRRRLVRDGTLRPLGTRTYCVAGAPSSVERHVLAACLDTGGVASHRTAAALFGLNFDLANEPVEVSVVEGRQSARSSLAKVHTTTWLPNNDRTHVPASGVASRWRSQPEALIPVTTVARTLFGLAGLVPEIGVDDVTDSVEMAVRNGLATDGWLWWRLEKLRRSGRNGVSVLEAILLRRGGGQATESWLERETLRILAAAGLPLPICQRRIERRGAFVARVDFSYPDQRLVIEVSGHLTHSSREARQRDITRANGVELAGHRRLEFTYEDVVCRPDYVVASVAAALGLERVA